MAALAAIALAVTVIVARRALEDAAQIVARGEGDSIIASLQRELKSGGRSTDAELATRLGEHQANGLRYVAIVEGDNVSAHAGSSTIAETSAHEGDLAVVGGRIRLVARLGPPKGPRHFDRDPEGGPHEHQGRPRDPTEAREDHPPGPPPDGPDFGPPPGERPDFGPGSGPRGQPHRPPMLVVEFETPVLDQLRAEMTRTVIVGGAAALVLLAFAIAWWQSAKKLAAVERQAELERRLVALGRMSSVMAHELRNPLASLKGHGQLLLESLEPGTKAHQKAERVVSDAVRLEELTNSLLEFAREGPLDRASVPPAELVRRALEHLPQDGVKVDLDHAPTEMWVDEARVVRAVSNLVANAQEATSGDEPVEVTVFCDRDDVLIQVRDHGPGLPETESARLFEPFVTTKVRGTGLGLPIARRVAEQHGGTLVAETHPEGGALFRMRLPDATRALVTT
jgi:two-component system sensor histidine kinase HydH